MNHISGQALCPGVDSQHKMKSMGIFLDILSHIALFGPLKNVIFGLLLIYFSSQFCSFVVCMYVLLGLFFFVLQRERERKRMELSG